MSPWNMLHLNKMLYRLGSLETKKKDGKNYTAIIKTTLKGSFKEN